MALPPLKVVLLAGRFEVRGSSTRTLHLAEQLPTHGIQPRIICIDAGRVAPERRKSVSISVMPSLEVPLVARAYRYVLERELQADPPDLLHVQWRGMLPLGRWLARRLGRPYVLTVHDYLAPHEQLRFDDPWAARVIAVSGSVRDELMERTRLPAHLVTVIHSGVPTNIQDTGLPVLDPGHVPVVGTAGALEAAKGLDDFLRAARIVSSSRPDVQFLICGAGPEETRLRRMSDELQLAGSVTFVPNLFDFAESLAAMDIFCLPAHKQGLGTIMLEAMARAKPVIATRAGGVERVVTNDVNGLLIAPSDSDDLAQRMLELLADPSRARSMGERARELVSREFRVDIMVEATAKLYREVIASLPARVPEPDARHVPAGRAGVVP